jgi:uncharacterized protein (TIGR00645 family)
MITRATASSPKKATMDDMPTLRRETPLVQRGLEHVIFGSRWLLAPFYVGLILSLIILMLRFARRAFELFGHAMSMSDGEITVGILSLIELALMGSLVLMVILSGYESFVSRLDVSAHSERLAWMGRIGFGELKLKLLASIVAISTIRLLEAFMDVHDLSNRDLGWLVGIQMAFVISGVLLALMDRVAGGEGH